MGRWLQGCGAVSRALAWVGGLALLASAAAISIDVITRALWKVAYLESFELSTYAFAIATSMGLSWALMSKAHIRIEIVYTLFPVRVRAWLDVYAYAGLALVAGVLLYWCGLTWWGNVQSGARSNSSLALPLKWPQGLWLLGIAWLAALAALSALQGLWLCLSGRHEQAHAQLGVATLKDEIEAGTGAPAGAPAGTGEPAGAGPEVRS